MRIGFIGTGTMGTPIAGELIAAGHRLTVYDVRPAAMSAMIGHGAAVADSPSEAAYGAEVVFTPPDEGSDGAIRKAQEMAAANPKKYFYADQYSNDANWQAHYYGTAEEIWRQTDGRITHFVATLGTSGTFMGTTRRLKELNPKIECISLQPDSPFHGLEGLKHMETAIVPRIYDPKLADRNIEISTEAAYKAVKSLARGEGLLVGISAGAALVGCEMIARELRGPAVIVTVFPDSADKYLSERFWDEV